MTIDDAAGRRSVRQRRAAGLVGEGTFLSVPSTSLRGGVAATKALRDDVHARAIQAAARALRARRPNQDLPKP